jgi:hypothetical protein
MSPTGSHILLFRGVIVIGSISREISLAGKRAFWWFWVV